MEASARVVGNRSLDFCVSIMYLGQETGTDASIEGRCTTESNVRDFRLAISCFVTTVTGQSRTVAVLMGIPLVSHECYGSVFS